MSLSLKSKFQLNVKKDVTQKCGIFFNFKSFNEAVSEVLGDMREVNFLFTNILRLYPNW